MSKKTLVSCSAAVPFVNVKLGDADNVPAQHRLCNLGQTTLCSAGPRRDNAASEGCFEISTTKIKLFW